MILSMSIILTLSIAAGRVTYMGESGALLNYIGEIYRDLNLGKPPVANPPELFLELCDQLNQENRLDVVTDKYAANITKVSPRQSIA